MTIAIMTNVPNNMTNVLITNIILTNVFMTNVLKTNVIDPR